MSPARARDLSAARVLALAAVLGSVGCGGASATCPVSRPSTGAALLEAHGAKRARLTTLRAEARVEQWGKRGRVRGTVRLMVSRPSRVRFDALTQFGPMLTLTSDGEVFALHDLEQKRFLTGPTCPKNIEALVGVPVSGEEIARLLLADVFAPPPAGAGETAAAGALAAPPECTGEGFLRVGAPMASGTMTYDFEVPKKDGALALADQRTRLVRVTAADPSGRVRWRAKLGDHRAVSARDGTRAEFPFEVDVEEPGSGARTRFRFQSVELGVSLPGDAFVQSPPPGMLAETASCE